MQQNKWDNFYKDSCDMCTPQVVCLKKDVTQWEGDKVDHNQ